MLQLQPLKPGDRGNLDAFTGLLLANLLNAWAFQRYHGKTWINSCPATIQSAHWDWQASCLCVPWGINGEEEPKTEFGLGAPFWIEDYKVQIHDQVYEFFPPDRW